LRFSIKLIDESKLRDVTTLFSVENILAIFTIAGAKFASA
jgi:hypothetical protein